MLHKRKHNREDCIDSVIGTAITRLLRQNNDWKDYRVDTFMERERVIKEISDQINQYALPFFLSVSPILNNLLRMWKRKVSCHIEKSLSLIIISK